MPYLILKRHLPEKDKRIIFSKRFCSEKSMLEMFFWWVAGIENPILVEIGDKIRVWKNVFEKTEIFSASTKAELRVPDQCDREGSPGVYWWTDLRIDAQYTVYLKNGDEKIVRFQMMVKNYWSGNFLWKVLDYKF